VTFVIMSDNRPYVYSSMIIRNLLISASFDAVSGLSFDWSVILILSILVGQNFKSKIVTSKYGLQLSGFVK